MNLGPVSAVLESELRERMQTHGIVVWLDADGHYSDFVDRLATSGGRPYGVHAFRGSFLELLMSLEGKADVVDKPRLLLHLPGFTEEDVHKTPLMELYKAGVRYRRKLDTLVKTAAGGRVPTGQIDAYLSRGVGSLAAADGWLAGLLGDGTIDGLTAQLRAMVPTVLLDDLLQGGFIARMGLQADGQGRWAQPEAQNAVWKQLEAWTDLPDAWRQEVMPTQEGDRRERDVAFIVSSWALAVEYVADLSRLPVEPRLSKIPNLPKQVIGNCQALAAHLRLVYPEIYQQTADATEALLSAEVQAASAADLGKVDTFRFEEDTVLSAALLELSEERWDLVEAWATPRLAGGSFWLSVEPVRQSAWQLVQGAAQLGQAIQRAGVALKAHTLEEALQRYTTAGMAVDQAHRHLEQRRAALLEPHLPAFEALRTRLDALRESWRCWADDWSRDFNALCKKQGFLPALDLQQRTLFDEVVRPMALKSGVTALFMVDALRFEMGAELFEAINGTPATTTMLRGRYAELPTNTAVGMNVLAPVAAQGRLEPVIRHGSIQGFQTGAFQVITPDKRRRAMWDRVGGTACPMKSLAEVLSMDAATLRSSVSNARLYIVHSQEIDQAGESGVGASAFEVVLRQLRSAWRLLREAGIRRFVFTSDHGFLLLDETVRQAQTHGRKIDPSRRHVLSGPAAERSNEAQVSLAALGYETGGEDLHLIFPVSTAVFDIGNKVTDFVHGGNSLQERVIPVLTVEHRAQAGGDTLQYALSGQAREEVAGMHCLAVRLEVIAQGALAFGGTREVELGVHPGDDAIHVELCQVRGGGRLSGGAILATPGEDFELFFKLSGPEDVRVLVTLAPTGGANVEPLTLNTRFAVTMQRRALSREPDPAEDTTPESAPPSSTPSATPAPAVSAPSDQGDWLSQLPEGGVRRLFAHLATHGTVTEQETIVLLGGARNARRLARDFDTYAERVPFRIRVDVSGGMKRYIREGGTPQGGENS